MLLLLLKQNSISMLIIALPYVEIPPIPVSYRYMCYPGVMSDTKYYLFHSICQQTLLYGLDVVNININMMEKMGKNAVWINEKSICDIPKRPHHT